VAPEETVAYSRARQPAMAWPVVSYLELAALVTAVPCFRLHSRAIAFEWGLTQLAEDIELIVSELVTNAILAARRADYGGLAAPVVRLWLASDRRGILIRVWDGSRQMPARQDAGPDDDSGRGLMLVECLASQWGAYRAEDGKVVWAMVR
jgi:anti-sigma regulatory factor (Ser/Thr protein kinase)